MIFTSNLHPTPRSLILTPTFRFKTLRLIDHHSGSVPLFLRRRFIESPPAAGGSCVSTILGYLQHASEDKNFDPAYAPWYVARPVMGLLLGLVFYFVVVGGLVGMNVVDSDGESIFSVWTLAGVGALVGLFSKNAVEKLREVFNTLFRTQKEAHQDLLARLPEEMQEQLKPYLEVDKKKPTGSGG